MIYDGIVVGGGHAGIEAALAMTRMNKKVILITGNLSKVASLPCNPSIGGPAKGVVVREIDALGGQMGKSADLGQIQIKMLNTSKGPAVRALRAQIDKKKYPEIMLEVLKSTPNLVLLEDLVESLIIENDQVKGVRLIQGREVWGHTVILTTGTYLNSHILVGHEVTTSGPSGEPTTFGISQQLKNLGFEVVRLKTGTPPRLERNSVDLSKMMVQPGDDEPYTFSFYAPYNEKSPKEACYLVHTTPKTKELILDNLTLSAMYGGIVEGVGPRYCPSIEDKIVRFNEKEKHQIFLEPESLFIDEWYVQGLSTSLPRDVQEKLIHSIPGLENAVIKRYAYAIEYDAINPQQLKPSLETKHISHLFCAGQINGTSGYEEAAGQGLMAGINAARLIDHQPAFILKRNEAYIGVLIDDLVTKGATEPYRLFPSRSEHRLLLRHDNADLRLSEYAHQMGLISEKDYQIFLNKKHEVEMLLEDMEHIKIYPTEENNAYLAKLGSAPIYEKVSVKDLLKRPEITSNDIVLFLEKTYSRVVYEQAEIHVKYSGYIEKGYKNADKALRLEEKMIPESIDYSKIKNLSSEAREKLAKIRPVTIGQASRILGVNPPDISILVIYIESGMRV